MGLEEAVSEKSETDRECLKKDIQMETMFVYILVCLWSA